MRDGRLVSTVSSSSPAPTIMRRRMGAPERAPPAAERVTWAAILRTQSSVSGIWWMVALASLKPKPVVSSGPSLMSEMRSMVGSLICESFVCSSLMACTCAISRAVADAS